MGTWDWQLVVALGCVALAVGVLVRRGVALVSRRKGTVCGSGCGSCPSAGDGLREKPLVKLELGVPRKEGQ